MLSSARGLGRTVRMAASRRHRAAPAPLVTECTEAAAGRMLAWRVHAYGDADELRLEEARVPPLRAPSQLLVRVLAASINPLDVAMIGGYGSTLLGAARRAEAALVGEAWEPGAEFPLVLGRDFVGEVVRVGATVSSRLHPGERVWGVVPPYRPGSHAQYVLAEEAWTGTAPRSLSTLEAGGTLYAALSACAVLRQAALPPDGPRVIRGNDTERALVLGLGGVGQMAVQLLVSRGTAVWAVCAGEQRALAEELGATHLDRHDTDLDRDVSALGTVSAVVDCAGLGGGAASSLVARGWRFRRFATLTSPLLRETDVRGIPLGCALSGAQLLGENAMLARTQCPPPQVRWALFRPSAADIALMAARAERGQLRVVVQQTVGWRDAARAYRVAAGGHARGKVLIDFTRD